MSMAEGKRWHRPFFERLVAMVVGMTLVHHMIAFVSKYFFFRKDS